MIKYQFPNYLQADSKDCGPTCLKIIAKFYGRIISVEYLRRISETTREGSGIVNLSEAAEQIGFKTLCAKVDFNTLKDDVPLPCILHWNKNHFIILYKISKKDKKLYFHISDPAIGNIRYVQEEFLSKWIGNNAGKDDEGVALILEVTPAYYSSNLDHEDKKSNKFRFLLNYLFQYKSLIFQIFFGLVLTSIISLLIPFLTQKSIDIGINQKDLNYVYIVFISLGSLYISRIAIDIIRSWSLLHLSSRVSIAIISDFFIKLMLLPISFYDTRLTGDLMQRINDNHRIEYLLTNSSINTIFSILNIFIFSGVLIYYSLDIFIVFITGAVLYFVWVLFFMKKRRELDYKRFSQVAQEQSKVIELISGMQEIKLYSAERQKRWNWEFIQIKLFKLRLKSLRLEQLQFVGGNTINQFKDLFISFIAVKLVISGNITLGMMVSIQYIMGQINAPLINIIDFLKQFQDAKISLDRLSEIEDKPNEDNVDTFYNESEIDGDISLNNISFRYLGSDIKVFEDLSLKIKKNKITAIVGSSGSGKTTLLKLLLKFYPVDTGLINIGRTNLSTISNKLWRKKCGVVMQDGFIFNDTIAHNIAIGDDIIDRERLYKAVTIANIKDFIESLPLSYNTVIGDEGLSLSGGQKQRIFIARAVYKNPDYLFFDEATSSLDANNEKVIMQNLNDFFVGRTVVVIAHRLSTVKNADKIIVINNGRIIEEGTHDELVNLEGNYYKLIINQLSIGK